MALQQPPLVPNPFPPNNLPAVQTMVASLCEEIGFAKEVRVHAVKGGNKYSNILFTCVMNGVDPSYYGTRHPCALRTPKLKYQTPYWQDIQMGRMAAFHHYSSKALPVPGVLVYDCTYGNNIQCSYMIMEQIPGHTLVEHYRQLSDRRAKFPKRPEADEAEDYAILGLMTASIIEQIERVYQFEHYGTLQMGDGMSLRSALPDRFRDQIHLPVIPFIWGRVSMQPSSKVIDFILELLNAQEMQHRNPLQEDRYRKLVDIALCLKIFEDDNHQSHRIEPSVLWHPDFHPRKIMMTHSRIFGSDPNNPMTVNISPVFLTLTSPSCSAFILGWDGALALPRIMTRSPPSFLWEEAQISAGNKEKVIKVRFDTEIERKLPGYCVDAYGEMSKIIRALGMYAVLGVEIEWKELSFKGLINAWEAYVAGKQVVVNGRWHKGEYLWGR